jgi:translocation and assembly module TamA
LKPLSGTRIAGLSAFLVALAIMPAHGAEMAGGALPFDLVAPEPAREYLATHLDPPVALSDGDTPEALLRRVQREVAELLAIEGWFSPQVQVRPAATREDRLTIEVIPGERTLVEDVNLDFNGPLGGSDELAARRRKALRAAWSLSPGEPFRSQAWQQAKTALLAGATDNRYAAARIVESHAEIDPDRARARLAVVIDSGPAYRFGALNIHGLKRYDAALVRRLASFAAGDPFDRKRLLTFQSRLQGTPWFQSALVAVDPADAVGEELPVTVTLAEAPAQRIGFGLGYSTNTGVRGEINYLHRDYLHRVWALGGGLQLERNQQSVSASLDLPADERGYRLGFAGKLAASDIQGLAGTREVLGVTRSRISGGIETRLGIEWQRDHQRPNDAEAETSQALTLDWRWIRRAVDSTLYPRQGNVVELRVGGASRKLLSDRDFLRTHLRAQAWWPVGTQDTLSLRGELGITAAASRSGIPQDYLFRTGGAQSVRGYAYQSLGVHDGSAVVGGRALALAGVEYTHWFDDQWGAAIFTDAGNAADIWSSLRPVVGLGAGVRWKSPAGPLALDVARGQENGRWHLHFAILVAF